VKKQKDDWHFSEDQQRKLSEMIYYAFLEIRLLGWAGKAEQAADLADAFHNLPKAMWKDDFNLVEFRDSFLTVYQEKYPDRQGRKYAAMVTKIILMGNPDYTGN
jgi:hypothetical protein